MRNSCKKCFFPKKCYSSPIWLAVNRNFGLVKKCFDQVYFYRSRRDDSIGRIKGFLLFKTFWKQFLSSKILKNFFQKFHFRPKIWIDLEPIFPDSESKGFNFSHDALPGSEKKLLIFKVVFFCKWRHEYAWGYFQFLKFKWKPEKILQLTFELKISNRLVISFFAKKCK